MQYALLIYGRADTDTGEAGSVAGALAAALAQPAVTGWVRLHSDASATTLRSAHGQALLTDGPFVESKEFLGGLIMVEAASLDEALVVAQQLREALPGVAIEVRPVREGRFRAG